MRPVGWGAHPSCYRGAATVQVPPGLGGFKGWAELRSIPSMSQRVSEPSKECWKSKSALPS